jgi:peptidoglycan/xylan/chitin deacetylase (PgdA/CDA1 family)
MLVIVAILLIIGTTTIYIIGERKLSEEKIKNISGAREVIADNIDSTVNNATVNNIALPVEPIKINKFDGLPLINNDKGIPILMYHSIDKEVDPVTGKLNELRVPKEVFREQMKYLKENGYITLTMSEVYDFFQNNKGVPEKSIVITFDDGYLDNYTNAYPILKEFGFNATVFIISGLVDKDKAYMTSEQLKEMELSGIEMQAHTANHPQLSTLDYENQMREIKDSKIFLENLLNKKIEYIAYPYGNYNENTLKIVKELEFKAAYLADGPWAYKNDGAYLYRRVYISSLRDMNNFIERITNPNYKR